MRQLQLFYLISEINYTGRLYIMNNIDSTAREMRISTDITWFFDLPKLSVIIIAWSFLSLVTYLSATANLADYYYDQTIRPYQEISGGTLLGNTTTDEQRFLSLSNPLGGTALTGEGIPIGFDFIFAGTTFDRLGINANGWISLGKSSASPSVNMSSNDYFNPLSSVPDIGDFVARIAGFAQNLQAQTGASLRMETLGTSPNRITVIQWKKYRIANTNGSDFNFQIRLYEGTNQIRIAYGSFAFTGNNRLVQVGLRAAPSTTASNYQLRESISGSDLAWLNTTSGLVPTATIRFREGTVPIDGQIFAFSPNLPSLMPAPISNLSITQTIDSLIFQWDASANAESYHIYSTDDPYGVEWELEAVINDTSWFTPLLDHNIFYRVHSFYLGQ